MKFKLCFTLFWLLLLSCSSPSKSGNAVRPEIQADKIKQHINYLAAPERKGRFPGTSEAQTSARYIADKFKEYGLKPGLTDGYFQPFEIKINRLGKNNALDFKKGNESKSLTPGTDFLPLNISANGRLAESFPESVNYGITAPEFQYDDYRNKDVKGKVVLIMSGLPAQIPVTNTKYSDVGVRVLNAQQHGAAGVIILPPAEPKLLGKIISENAVWEEHLPEPITKRLNSLEAKLKYLTPRSMTLSAQSRVKQTETPITIPAVLLTDSSLIQEFLKSPADYQLGFLEVEITEEVVYQTENVIGLIPGTIDESVILGAHYDHLGVDKDGDIFPGANDNASGIAGLLELARVLSVTKPKRTLVFIAFGGEELGLYGSRYYTNQPVIPLKQTGAMLNMDMISVPKEPNQLYLVGGAFNPELAQAAKDENKTIGLTIKDNIDFVFKFGSDHYSFHQKKVPAIDFTTGPFGAEHTVQDTPDKVQPEMAKKICDLVLATVLRLAGSDLRFPEPKDIEVPFPTGGKHPGGQMVPDKDKPH